MSQKTNSKSLSIAENAFELGRLYFEKGDFETALSHYKEAENAYLKAKAHGPYLKTVQKSLRIFAEQEDYKSIEGYKLDLQEMALKEKISLDAKTYYVLALCAFFKSEKELALEYTEKSLALALAEDDKEDICYAIHGISIIYTDLGRLEEALKEIYNLRVFFQVIDNSELQIQSDIVCAHIMCRMGKFEEALDILWAC